VLRLDGKVALVTGCGTIGEGWGNGKAIAVLLARQRTSIFGCDLDLSAAQATRTLIQEEGGVAEVQACDVTKAADIKALVDACMARFGLIDILVNNVGRSEPGDPVTMDEAVWDEQLDVNLKAAFLMCKGVLPIMAPGRRLGGQHLLDRWAALHWQAAGRVRGVECGADADDADDRHGGSPSQGRIPS